jgi:hypothetical protein
MPAMANQDRRHEAGTYAQDAVRASYHRNRGVPASPAAPASGARSEPVTSDNGKANDNDHC